MVDFLYTTDFCPRCFGIGERGVAGMVDFCGKIVFWFGDAWQNSRKDFLIKVASRAISVQGCLNETTRLI